MGLWEQYNKVTIGIYLALFVAAVFLYPVGAIVHDRYFKKEHLFQCKVSEYAVNGYIVVVDNEKLIQHWDSLQNLQQFSSDIAQVKAGSLLYIGGFSSDSSYVKVYYGGGWKGSSETTGFTRLENLECWPLVQAQ